MTTRWQYDLRKVCASEVGIFFFFFCFHSFYTELVKLWGGIGTRRKYYIHTFDSNPNKMFMNKTHSAEPSEKACKALKCLDFETHNKNM